MHLSQPMLITILGILLVGGIWSLYEYLVIDKALETSVQVNEKIGVSDKQDFSPGSMISRNEIETAPAVQNIKNENTPPGDSSTMAGEAKQYSFEGVVTKVLDNQSDSTNSRRYEVRIIMNINHDLEGIIIVRFAPPPEYSDFVLEVDRHYSLNVVLDPQTNEYNVSRLGVIIWPGAEE